MRARAHTHARTRAHATTPSTPDRIPATATLSHAPAQSAGAICSPVSHATPPACLSAGCCAVPLPSLAMTKLCVARRRYLRIRGGAGLHCRYLRIRCGCPPRAHRVAAGGSEASNTTLWVGGRRWRWHGRRGPAAVKTCTAASGGSGGVGRPRGLAAAALRLESRRPCQCPSPGRHLTARACAPAGSDLGRLARSAAPTRSPE
jgi:hypothetical protein